MRQLAGVKALEAGAAADLDYGRYGDTLFELLVTGGRFAGGSVEVEYSAEAGKLATNVRGSLLAQLARPCHLRRLRAECSSLALPRRCLMQHLRPRL